MCEVRDDGCSSGEGIRTRLNLKGKDRLVSGGAVPAQRVRASEQMARQMTKQRDGAAGTCGEGGMPSKQKRASRSVSSHAPVTVTVTAVVASFSTATLVVSE